MPPRANVQAALLRLQKDLADIEKFNKDVVLTYPNPQNLMVFDIAFKVNQGFWKDGIFSFRFAIPPSFPNRPPKITINTKIFHPNIQEDEPYAVCLNIIRDNYVPTFTISQMIVGLQYLFNEPNPHSPLNIDAANLFLQNQNAFKNKVCEYIAQYCPKELPKK